MVRPNKKTLFFCAIGLYVLVGIFLCVLFLAEKEVRPVFAYSWTILFALIVSYMLYGYVRLLFLGLLERKQREKLKSAFLRDKTFRSVYTRASGVIAGFAFVGWNLYNAIVDDLIFHWVLAEFYWFVSIIRLYMDYIADREDGVKKDISYLIINVCLLFLSGVIVSIVSFVIYFDGIFRKSWWTVFPFAIFAFYKIISSVYALIKARKTHSVYDLTFAQTSFSCALFSLYTLMISLVVLFEGGDSFKWYAYSGFGVACVVFVFGLSGVVSAGKRLSSAKKKSAPDAP